MSLSAVEKPGNPTGYAWARRGDINAFFGLMLDNIGGMILMASLLVTGFGLPATFVLTRMIPGTAAGVLFGDLVYTAMAFRLARRTGRTDVTAMPLGLDTPSTFGAVLFIIGPAFNLALSQGSGARISGSSCLVSRHFHVAGLGDLQNLLCSPEWMDTKTHSTSRTARFLDSDRTRIDQFLALPRYRDAASCGNDRTGPDAGDADGPLAIAAASFRVLWVPCWRVVWSSTS